MLQGLEIRPQNLTRPGVAARVPTPAGQLPAAPSTSRSNRRPCHGVQLSKLNAMLITGRAAVAVAVRLLLRGALHVQCGSRQVHHRRSVLLLAKKVRMRRTPVVCVTLSSLQGLQLQRRPSIPDVNWERHPYAI